MTWKTSGSTLGKDSSVPLMYHDPSNLGDLSTGGFLIHKNKTRKIKRLTEVEGG